MRLILADVEEAEAALFAGHAEPRGELKVTAPVRFGQMHVAPGLIELAQRWPQLKVDLTLLDRVVDLIEEGFDASIRIAPLPDSSMVAIPVGSVRRVVVASPEQLGRVPAPESPSSLSALPCVRFVGTAPGGGWSFAEDGRNTRVAIQEGFRSNDASTAIEACVAALGFGQFLSYQVAPMIEAGRLVEVLHAFSPSSVRRLQLHPNYVLNFA